MFLCASALRPIPSGGFGPLLHLAADLGVDGVHLGADLLAGQVATAGAEALKGGLRVGLASAPLPERPLGPGRRLPFAAALDREERLAAVQNVTALFPSVAALGCRTLAVSLGLAPLSTPMGAIERLFARGELFDEEGEPARPWRQTLDERKGLGPRLQDACRWFLEAALPAAEGHGLRLALTVAGHPWAVPSPKETEELLAEFRGAPLAVVWDPAQLHRLDNLGLRVGPQRLARLQRQVGAVYLNDAVGLDALFLPGLGEAPLSEQLRGPAGGTEPWLTEAHPVVLAGRPDSQVAEARTALQRARGWLEPAPPSRKDPPPAATM